MNEAQVEQIQRSKGSSIRVEGISIEVYPTDLYGLYSWDEAVKAVKLLGDGWRLPTKGELNKMYIKKKEICGFVAIYYWSSSEDGLYYARNQNFVNGYQHSKFKYDHKRIRPVRDLKPIKERIDKVVSEKPSTWKEEAEEHEKNHKLYDKLADVELRLECCRDASTGKDLLITALEKRIAELEDLLEEANEIIGNEEEDERRFHEDVQEYFVKKQPSREEK